MRVQRRAVTGAVWIAAFLAGCDVSVGGAGSAFVEGEVPSGLRTLDESGSLSASLVQALTVDLDGVLEVVAEAEIAADGSYQIEVPAYTEGIVIRATDQAGAAVAATMLALAPDAGETTDCGEMSEESSVEAEVWVRASAQAATNLVGVQQRIDGQLGAAVGASADLAESLDDLASAIVAAQATEVRAMADQGVDTTASALFSAEQQASLALTAALAAGASPDDAETDLHATVDGILEGLGLDVRARSRVETSVSTAVRAVADAEVDDPAVYDALVRAAAALEARASAQATVDLFAESGADETVTTAAAEVGAALQVAIDAAASADAIDAAWSSYQAALVGTTDVEAELSLLATLMGAGTLLGDELAALVDVRAEARADLSAALDAAAGEVSAGAEALADAVVEAQAAFESAVAAGAKEVSSLEGAQLDAAIGLSVESASHAAL